MVAVRLMTERTLFFLLGTKGAKLKCYGISTREDTFASFLDSKLDYRPIGS
jgi:hypothetical protein